ncbi:MAG: RIP metalloprotease RseP [Alphaproteobacteria bacterium]|nr:RIP metalloprotease RseP [Alphaproteobacteria bacterium]
MDSVNLITGFLTGGVIYIAAFLIVVGVIVFVHELGHFQVGRWCGARIEAFSIGFGKPILRWTDRKGTIWQVGWLPIGGYVKFWGDENAISMSREERLRTIADDPDARECFHFKPIWQRALIVAAGPVVNFIFAIVIFAGVYTTAGYPWVESRIGTVMEGSGAAAAGLKPGDLVTSIDGAAITEFRDLQLAVLFSGGDPLRLDVERDGGKLALTATPIWQKPDNIGRFVLGVTPPKDAVQHWTTLGPAAAVMRGAKETKTIVHGSLTFLGGLISGREDPRQLSGPVGIAEKAGEAIQISFLSLLMLMGAVSVSIGLINLFPIPMLDGGHLLFYAIEAVRRRPLTERTQEFGLRIGLALVLSVMLFATWNDLMRIFWS